MERHERYSSMLTVLRVEAASLRDADPMEYLHALMEIDLIVDSLSEEGYTTTMLDDGTALVTK